MRKIVSTATMSLCVVVFVSTGCGVALPTETEDRTATEIDETVAASDPAAAGAMLDAPSLAEDPLLNAVLAPLLGPSKGLAGEPARSSFISSPSRRIQRFGQSPEEPSIEGESPFSIAAALAAVNEIQRTDPSRHDAAIAQAVLELMTRSAAADQRLSNLGGSGGAP